MNKERIIRWLCGLCLAMYIGVLAYFLFFAEMMGRSTADRAYSYNLEPFREIYRFIRYRDKLGATAVWLNLAGNIAAFIPFGWMVPSLFKPGMKLWQLTLCTMSLSLSIESVQLFFRVGSFDVDDIILNTLGGMIGGAAYCFIRWRKKSGK